MYMFHHDLTRIFTLPNTQGTSKLVEYIYCPFYFLQFKSLADAPGVYSLGFQKAMDSVSGVDTGDEELVNPFKFPELSWKSAGSHFSTDSLYFIDYMAC